MKNTIFRTAAIAALAFSFAGMAAAQTHWDAAHPRRDEVNDRIANQNHRIQQEVREGEMTRAEAKTLHRDDRKVRREERLMASQNGSHITKQEQRTLNQQENQIGKQIGH